MRLTHVGRNYPCLTDPNYGSITVDNSSTIQFAPNASISFLQLANWGKNYFLTNLFNNTGLCNFTSFCEGSGPYNDKGILDDDTVQITTYHYYRFSKSNVTLNATAVMASNITIIPVDVTLEGSQVHLIKCIIFAFKL